MFSIGPGTVERHQRDDVLDAVGPHADQRLAHAGTFHLEHADHFAARQHGVGVGVVERDRRQVDLDAAAADQLHRRLQHGQRLQAEEVELHQPGLLDIFHVELGDRHVRARIAVHRHQFRQRPVADDDAGGVRRSVAVEPFQLLRHVEQRLDDRLFLGLLGKARLVGDGVRQLDRIGRVLRHHLGQLVDLAVRHLQHAADVAQHGARLQRTEGDDLPDLVAAVFLLDVADDLFAPVLAEVDVEVGHRHAVGIEEALEQQREAQRVDVGDGGGIGDQRSGARTAARPDRNALRLRPFDEVGDDQEVAGEFHLLDDGELEIEPLAILLDRIAGSGSMRRQPRVEPFMGLAAQFVGLGLQRHLIVGDIAAGKARQDRVAVLGIVGAAQRDLDGVVDRFRQIGEQPCHIGLAAQEIVRCQPAAVVGGDDRAFGNGDQRVMRVIVVAGGEERLIGGDQRQIMDIGKIDRRFLDGAVIAGDAVQLDIEPVAKQRLERQQPRFGEIAAILLQAPGRSGRAGRR